MKRTAYRDPSSAVILELGSQEYLKFDCHLPSFLCADLLASLKDFCFLFFQGLQLDLLEHHPVKIETFNSCTEINKN